MVSTLFCIGFGYVAKALAQRLQASSADTWRIIGTSRNPGEAPEGVELYKFPNGPSLPVVSNAYVLISAAPEDQGCSVYTSLKGHFDSATWSGYLSSTGVYGDMEGRWAFESSPVSPLSQEARRRVIAEAQWNNCGAEIFRLPGIYGPGRSAFDRLRAGKARRIIRAGQIFSRAHVDDIASLLQASMESPRKGAIYNVSDDAPSPPQDVITYAASLLNMEPPAEIEFDKAGLPPKAQRFYLECKRVSNALAKSELGWRPRYPDYQSGLTAILQAETAMSRST